MLYGKCGEPRNLGCAYLSANGEKLSTNKFCLGCDNIIKKYYVYAWFDCDTEYVFYVGMGSGTRAFVRNYR